MDANEEMWTGAALEGVEDPRVRPRGMKFLDDRDEIFLNSLIPRVLACSSCFFFFFFFPLLLLSRCLLLRTLLFAFLSRLLSRTRGTLIQQLEY